MILTLWLLNSNGGIRVSGTKTKEHLPFLCTSLPITEAVIRARNPQEETTPGCSLLLKYLFFLDLSFGWRSLKRCHDHHFLFLTDLRLSRGSFLSDVILRIVTKTPAA